MSAAPGIWVVIPAAGIGGRFSMGSNGFSGAKQYARLGDATVLEHSVSALLKRNDIRQLVIALHPDDVEGRQLPLLQHEKIHFVVGGVERSDSVLQALLYLQDFADADDWVLVHDAARPCLSENDLQKLFHALMNDPVGGILAVPAIDTLKQVEQGRVVSTIDRSFIWQALTPQMFRFSLLLKCLREMNSSGLSVTDESSAIESCGYQVKIVSGERSNIKITYFDDLALAGFFLHAETKKREDVP